MTTGAEKRQLPALTGIRFFLALWVVIYHQSPTVTAVIGDASSLQRGIDALLQTGYAAVGFFFVLSGFVLAYNYDLKTLGLRRNATRFGIARISRIYPAYLIGILLFVPLAVYRVVAHVSSDGYGTINFILGLSLLQSWAPSAALTWNFPGWSLSNEVFFYAILPLIGGWLYRAAGENHTEGKMNGAVKLLAYGAALWALSMAVPLFTVIKQVPLFGDAPATDIHLDGAGLWANFVRYNPLLRLPEFCAGVLLARAYQTIATGSDFQNRGWLFYVPGIVIALALLANGEQIAYPLMHNGLLIPAWALTIYGFALGGGLLVKLLSQRAIVFLGNASYSMYILHAPVSAWIKICFVRVLQRSPEGMAWFWCYVIACVVVSCVFFQVVEDPLHRWMKRQLNRWADRRTAAQVRIVPNAHIR